MLDLLDAKDISASTVPSRSALLEGMIMAKIKY